MKQLTITLNTFHGCETHTVPGEITPDSSIFDEPGYSVEITEAGASRFGCKICGCRCGGALPKSFWVPASRVARREDGLRVEARGVYFRDQRVPTRP
jgi:hypothetical protein